MSACPQNIWNHTHGCTCSPLFRVVDAPAGSSQFGSYSDAGPDERWFGNLSPERKRRAVESVIENHPSVYEHAYERASENAQDHLSNVLDLKGLTAHAEITPVQGRGVGFSGEFDAEGMNHLVFKHDPEAPAPPLVRSYDSSMRAPYVTIGNPNGDPWVSESMISYDWGDSGYYDPEPDEATREKREAYEEQMNSYLEDVSYHLAKRADADVDAYTSPEYVAEQIDDGYLGLDESDFAEDGTYRAPRSGLDMNWDTDVPTWDDDVHNESSYAF